LNFLTEKIQKYHEKKLNDALHELQFHQEIKKRLETNLKTTLPEPWNDMVFSGSD